MSQKLDALQYRIRVTELAEKDLEKIGDYIYQTMELKKDLGPLPRSFVHLSVILESQ